MTDSTLSTRYDPKLVEQKWYARWEENGLFEPRGDGEPYCITIPPPNVTGSLHMGHALCYSVQDVLGRWMRMFTIPNQSSVAKAFQEFDDAGRMKPSAYYERIVDVMEELVRFTVLMRPHVAALTDRYSERKQAKALVDPEHDLSAIAVAAQAL